MSKKKYLCIFLSILTIFTIISTWRFVTKGFRPQKILFNISSKNAKTITDIEDKSAPLEILDLDFSYLNKGSQAFVFISNDNRYVIKFLALNKYKEPFRRTLLSFFSILKTYRIERRENREKNFKAALKSYALVYENIKSETGVIYMHLDNNKKLNGKIKIVDPLGQRYKIDPNDCLFIIQRKANRMKPYLSSLIHEKDFEEIKKIISAYLENADKILKKGIINRDSSVKNSGITEEGIIEVDIGRFQKVEDIDNHYSRYLQKYTRLYRKYLEATIPDLVPYFDEKTKNLRDRNG